MEIRYYVCGLGYDENYCVTDHEQTFGDFDTYDEAFKLFEKLQSTRDEIFFKNASEIYQLVIQIEECEKDDDEINCIDVYDEWWVINPNYNKKDTGV